MGAMSRWISKKAERSSGPIPTKTAVSLIILDLFNQSKEAFAMRKMVGFRMGSLRVITVAAAILTFMVWSCRCQA